MHDRLDSLGGPTTSRTANSTAPTLGGGPPRVGAKAETREGGEANLPSRASAPADGGRRPGTRYREVGGRERRKRAQVEAPLQDRQTAGTARGCPSDWASTLSLSETDCAQVVAE